MSHVALRRVMIRMLHDPGFVAAVYADPTRALAGLDVDATERAWLTAPPPAAWRTDPERPHRVLCALRDEYPATVALAPARAATFFASAAFHDAVQRRGSLALAFGAHLAADADPAVVATARLECAIATARRASRTVVPSGAGQRRLTPRAALALVPAGAIALYDAVRAGRSVPPLGADTVPVLALRAADGGDVALEELEPALHALLAAAAVPRADDALLAAARRLGAEPGEDAEIVAQLVRDGLLV